MKGFVIGVVGVAGAALSLSACSLTPYAAVINGQEISSASFNQELSDLASNAPFVASFAQSGGKVLGQGDGTYSLSFVDQILNRRISIDLIAQSNARAGIRISASDLALASSQAAAGFGGAAVFSSFAKSYQTQLIRDTAEVNALESRLTHILITPSALNAYYQAHAKTYSQICASQILVGSQAQAQAIVQQLSSGGDFATLAKTDSKDPNTASRGGLIGCGTASQYQQAFGSAFAAQVVSLSVGAYSQPVQTSSGVSIVEVNSRTTQPLNSVIPQVVSSLFGSKGQSMLGNDVLHLVKVASIRVNPAYGQVVNRGGQIGVVPPTAPSKTVTGVFTSPGA